LGESETLLSLVRIVKVPIWNCADLQRTWSFVWK